MNKIKNIIKIKDTNGVDKTFELNSETLEYESGDSILNTSNIKDVEEENIKDKEWINNERNKIKNKDTLQDKENNKMVEEHKSKKKEAEKE